jgi:hypothetical protein
VLTIVVLPLTIYLLQLLSKVCMLAALAAGALVVLKMLLELLGAPAPARRQQLPPRVSCHYCQRHAVSLRPHPHPDHRLPPGTQVCESCYERYLLTATYMSTHYEPL